MARKSSFFALPAVIAVALVHSSFAVAQHSSTDLDAKLARHVKLASELTSRARANVYFANPQDIFRGVQFNYVNVGLGNLTFLRRDLVVSGRIPIVFARVYDSSASGDAGFGPGWRLSAAETISVENHTAKLLSENGSVIEFTEGAEGVFALSKDRPSDYLELRKTRDTLQLKLRTGFTKEFKLIGESFLLTKVTDKSGNDIRLTYKKDKLSKIENAKHFVEIERDEKGRITSAHDDQGRKASYRYDPKGRLVEVDDLGGAAWLYSYTEDNKLKAATDPMKRLNFEVSYDDAGRVRRLRQPSGVIQFSYDSSNSSTTVIDRRQLVSRYLQNDEGVTTRIVNPLGEETAIRLDAARNVVSLSRNGSVVQSMEYDQDHRITNRHAVTAGGSVDASYKYDPASGALTGINAGGSARTFGYDSNGDLSTAVTDDGLHHYGFSAEGDLAAYSAKGVDLTFTPDSDGLTAAVKDAKDNTNLDYKTGGQLSNIAFADGSKAKYEYQPSGLRAKLTYNDGRRILYTYDPAGNLLSTEIFDIKGKQVQGQKLTLNDSYQVVKRLLFDGTEERFDYDPNGNLTRHTKNGTVTKFEYDELNRLVTVLTPTGERLTYTYTSGERSIVEQYQHSSTSVADLIDSGFTFANAFQVMATRPVTSSLGTVRFSESLGTFQLANASGSEIITPETTIEQALQKLIIVEHNTPLKKRQNLFNRPFNTIFMPAEYASINCCFSCSLTSCRTTALTGDSDTSDCCPPCDPPPPTIPAPPVPHITGIAPSTAVLNASPVQVTLPGSFTVAASTPQITITPSGVITASVTGSSSSQITATFTFAPTAPVGNYSIAVIDDGGQSDNIVVFSLLPYVTQDKQLWWFGGATPPSTFTLGALQVTFTANGGGSQGTFAWTFTAGADKASFSNNQSSITVINSNTVNVVSTASSITPNDVSVTVTYTPPNGSPLSAAPYSFAVDAPFSLQAFADPALGPTATTHFSASVCGPPPPSGGPDGYESTVSYEIRSRLGTLITNIGINELFGGTRDLQTNNWPAPVAKAVVAPKGTFFDEICVTDNSNRRSPHPVSPQNPLGSNAVNESRQTWFIGSTQPGMGVPVQNDSLRRYTDHGIHTDIVSPVTQ